MERPIPAGGRTGTVGRQRSAPRNHRPPELAPAFGPSLTRLRESRGLTQKQLAESGAIDPSTISRLESGGRGPSREVVDRLAEALDASAEEHNVLLAAAGLLPENPAYLLGEPDLARLSAVLSDARLTPFDRRTLLTYVELALGHAEALGYAVPRPGKERAAVPA